MKTTIRHKADIHFFVQSFYTKVRTDELIGPIFEKRIQGNWEFHLKKMTGFWNTVLFGQIDYKGNPFQPHASLAIDKTHFDRWLALLRSAVKENFEGKKAEEILWRGDRMAEMFQRKLAQNQDSNFKTVL